MNLQPTACALQGKKRDLISQNVYCKEIYAFTTKIQDQSMLRLHRQNVKYRFNQ